MITLYVGLPRSGKTTLIASIAYKFAREGKTVYTNVHLTDIPHIYITPDMLGKYEISNGVVLIDEGAVSFNPRGYKNLPKYTQDWLVLHGHSHVDIFVFTQRYKGVDVIVRELTETLYYVRKPKGFFGRFFTFVQPIRYKLVIPDDGEDAGEPVEGYQLYPWYVRIFLTKTLFRPKWYKYFDSWEREILPPIPSSN